MGTMEPVEQATESGSLKENAKDAKLVTGIFDARDAASTAVDALLHYGRSPEDISMIMSSGTRAYGPAASASVIVYGTVAGAPSGTRPAAAKAACAARVLPPSRPSISPGEKWARSSCT